MRLNEVFSGYTMGHDKGDTKWEVTYDNGKQLQTRIIYGPSKEVVEQEAGKLLGRVRSITAVN